MSFARFQAMYYQKNFLHVCVEHQQYSMVHRMFLKKIPHLCSKRIDMPMKVPTA